MPIMPSLFLMIFLPIFLILVFIIVLTIVLSKVLPKSVKSYQMSKERREVPHKHVRKAILEDRVVQGHKVGVQRARIHESLHNGIIQYECQIVTYEYEFDEERNTVKTIFDFADQDAPDTVPVYIEKDKKPHVYIRTHAYRDFW